MAGVAEMLLQSYEGYIELLSSLPKAWENGSYEGLVARGSFEVSANWESGHATFFKILSRVGGNCQIKYPGIDNVQIKNDSGNTIPFSKLENKLIQFSSKPGETYLITIQ